MLDRENQGGGAAARGLADPGLEALVRAIPKAELHVHLEGSIVPELALSLAKRRNVALPGAERGVEGLREAYRFATFKDFLRVYVALSNTLQQAEDFADAVYGIAQRLARQQVRWVEMTFTPMTHVVQGVSVDAMLAGLADGRGRAREELGVEFAWVFDVVRSLPEQGEQTLEIALRARDQGVVAIGIGGPEGPQWSVAPLASTFARARAEGLKSVPHAGEQHGPPSLRETLDLLAPDRIGHGVRCMEDRELTAEIVDRGIPLEVCPSSNVALGVTPRLADHPLPQLLAAGVQLSLASDDPPLFGTTLVDEYLRCAATFDYGRDEILALARAAVEHSFMPEARKRELQAEQERVARGA
ncbi:Aminodeoxyfutalosine deaminase [Enhygromyxa salina]|uniref:Aminodeoxyfutalosine deaminase n=1 Tax=Enhygromyxa salina TaxID=215803 RepID=A0A2S9YJJ0_9BACT|nr:adenosine deaminase [Enhygromyxa salina]PRQ05273.1 Aminodeoxyfutalosine deaminase [Enhygromyxa salina]